MSQADAYADLYLNFRDEQQWLADTFAAMTFMEYQGFIQYCFKELDFANEAKDGAEFRRVKGLIMALARKELETAYFMDGLTDAQRASTRGTATAYYELAKGFYPAEVVPGVEAAWAASLDLAARYGWPTVIFDVQAPHRIFRDPDGGAP